MTACSVREARVERGSFSLEAPEVRLEPGRIYAVVGPNGAGKTTFLDLVALLARPAQGEVTREGARVDWGDAAALVRWRRRAAYLMQGPYLFRGTVAENIAYGLRLRGTPRRAAHERAAEMAARLSLGGLLRRWPHELSGGEAQRVALARALVLEVPLVLLDEPTANVDRQHVALVEELMRRTCAERGACVVLTTHSEGQARRLGAEPIAVEDGRVRHGAPPAGEGA
jgi:ABC-type lipoprotein export system ATPase subunit